MSEVSAVQNRDRALHASIDVGTNTVKLTIADLSDGRADAVVDTSGATRLGEGMQANAQRLREVPMRRTIDALAEMVAIAREHDVSVISAVGTAALRAAENRDEFLRRVKERCGLVIDVIPGEEEARLSFLAVRRDPHWRECAYLNVIDIGGGSTEIIRGEPNSDRMAARESVNIGAVRLTETYLKSDPPTIAQLNAANKAALDGLARFERRRDDSGRYRAVGVGGTITNLGAMDLQGESDPAALHGHRLSAERLEIHLNALASRTIEQRKELPGLDPRRADIILGGAILLSQALAHIGSAWVDISTRGLRWGVLYDRFAGER